MNYIYFLANASLTLRVIDYANSANHFPSSCLTVINRIDGWIVKIKFDFSLTSEQEGDFLAFMKELGFKYEPEALLSTVFWSLDAGESTTEVMRRYQIAIIDHGYCNRNNIQQFCQNFLLHLGYYCPETMA
ncbi:MAG: hypothetical protein QNJ54_30040 [Prochloraceae cyanobacterium]|nr:hypothetical protein [Prochloraceae cyanobacterium]